MNTETPRTLSTENVSRDRPAEFPGACECERCGCIFIGEDWHSFCGVCITEVKDELSNEQEKPL